MKVLLDTHCFLWWFADDPRLGAHARELMGEPENDVLLSAASSWEIAIKISLGKLTLPGFTFRRDSPDRKSRDFRLSTFMRYALHHCRRIIKIRSTG